MPTAGEDMRSRACLFGFTCMYSCWKMASLSSGMGMLLTEADAAKRCPPPPSALQIWPTSTASTRLRATTCTFSSMLARANRTLQDSISMNFWAR